MPSWTSETVWFAELASAEVDALDRERTILVLPTGCTEQQGPHLPLDVDTYLVSLFLSEAAQRVRAEGIIAYLLPALPYGPAEEHMAFPGTVSISFETHHRLVKEMLQSLARHGFRKLLVAMGCGGHHCLPAAMEARAELRRTGLDAQVWAIRPGSAYYEIAKEVFDWEPADIHAGEFPTSVLLARRLDAVRRERLAERARSMRAPCRTPGSRRRWTSRASRATRDGRRRSLGNGYWSGL